MHILVPQAWTQNNNPPLRDVLWNEDFVENE